MGLTSAHLHPRQTMRTKTRSSCAKPSAWPSTAVSSSPLCSSSSCVLTPPAPLRRKLTSALTSHATQVPLPLFFSSHIYSKAGFYVWVIVPFLWVFCTSSPSSPLPPSLPRLTPRCSTDGTFAVVVYPIYESRAALGHIFRSMKDDMSGKRKRVMAEQAGEKVAE